MPGLSKEQQEKFNNLFDNEINKKNKARVDAKAVLWEDNIGSNEGFYEMDMQIIILQTLRDSFQQGQDTLSSVIENMSENDKDTLKTHTGILMTTFCCFFGPVMMTNEARFLAEINKEFGDYTWSEQPELEHARQSGYQV